MPTHCLHVLGIHISFYAVMLFRCLITQLVQFNLNGMARMFGTAVFSLEGVGAVLILRNDLKERQDMSWYVLGRALSLCGFVSVGRVHVWALYFSGFNPCCGNP